MIPALLGMRVLLVEDYPFHQLLVKNLLGDAGVQVSVFSDGGEAIEAVKREKFDAILMDIQMPGMDGLEATRILRQDFAPEELPIIALTANFTREQQDQYISAGMNECIPKPIHYQCLYDALIRCTYQNYQSKKPEQVIFDGYVESGECFCPAVSMERVGSKEIYLFMLDAFIAGYSHTVQKIMNAISANDIKEAKRAAHSLKGASATVGAPLLYESARQLEVAFAGEESWKYWALIERLRAELFRVVHAMDTFMNENAI